MLIQVERLIKAIVSAEWAESDDIDGCSDEQIAELEETLSITLPESYKHFLRAMGCGAGDFESESVWTISELSDLNSNAKASLESFESHFRLKPSSFVFMQRPTDHEGVIYFFDTADGAEPAIYSFEYDIEQEEPEELCSSFSNWLEDYAEQIEEVVMLDDEKPEDWICQLNCVKAQVMTVFSLQTQLRTDSWLLPNPAMAWSIFGRRAAQQGT